MNPPKGSPPYPPVAPTEPAALSPSVQAAGDLDDRLVRRMKAGDEQALGEFYDRWYPVVNGVVTRMLKSADDVDDIVEETFWQAWKQADRYEAARGSVQTWLLTMARSRALDRLRATRRRREEPIEVGTLEPASIADNRIDPSLVVEHAERRNMVVAALADLPHEQRETLELGYFGGLSQSEIAERTGLPLGTVKTRMRLAMQKLRERLAPLREESR